MKKSRKMAAVAGLLGAVITMGVIAGGYWKLTGSTLNILTMGTFQNKIEEKYKVPEEVNPGESIDKVVNVKNTGDVDSLIRVRVDKVFGREDSDGNFTQDKNLGGDGIHIDYGKKWWLQKEDGYFYYRDILKPGETTKEPLFEKYQLLENLGNEYMGAEGHIVVTMEAIQADENLTQQWGVTEKDLGITLKQGSEGKKTNVVYNGKNGGFQISQSTTDLFASFKMLTPGCARTQIIEVENRSSENTEIFLRAEMPQQSGTSEKQRKLIEDLMQTYASIEVTENGKVLYKGPVSGSGEKGSMRQDISLGKFAGNEKKNLVVKLSLDPDMDTDFTSLTGKVKWIFTAQGDDGKTVTTTTPKPTPTPSKTFTTGPKTGDETVIFVWIIAAAAAVAVFLVIYRRGRRDNEID